MPKSLSFAAARWTVLASRYRHCVHAYHGVDAFSRDGRRLLYAGINARQRASLVVRDLASDEEIALADDLPCNYHTAARQRWVLGDTAVLAGADGRDGLPCPVLAYVDQPGRTHLLREFEGCSVRHICPDQVHASASRGVGESAAVVLLNLRTRTLRELVNARRCVSALPAELQCDPARCHINHPVLNDQGTSIFFKLMNGHGPQQRFVALFTYHLDDDLLCCKGKVISGHPFWMPDGRRILNVQSPRDGTDHRWLVTQDSREPIIERVIDTVIEGPGHPAVSPDGRWISSDGFSADHQLAWVYLVDPQARSCACVAVLPHRFAPVPDQSHPHRGQPHPVWSPDSRRLLVNCNFGGGDYRLVLLDDFLPQA